MQILGVYLNNIRSYKSSTIVFPSNGITVIYGPTGSGKTSILMAISHALFGFPPGSIKGVFEAYEQPAGKDLLRVGERVGLIRLLITSRGKLYLIERSFEQVGDGYRFRHGRIREYSIDPRTKNITCTWESPIYTSATEFNAKIEEIIGIKEKFGGKGLVKARVYTSALYVPQFNIHEILEYSDEERVEVIERAFGLERYKLAKKNLEEVFKAIEKEIGMLDALIRRLVDDLGRINKEQLKQERLNLEKELSRVTAELERIEAEKAELEKQLGVIKLELEQALQQKQELELQKRMYEDTLKQLKELEERARKRLGDLLAKYKPALGPQGLGLKELVEIASKTLEERQKALSEELEKARLELAELERRLQELNNSIRGLLEEIGRLRGEYSAKKEEQARLDAELEEKRELISRGICPLCLQPITHEHGEKLVKELASRREDVAREVERLEKLLEQREQERGRLMALVEELTQHYEEKKRAIKELEALAQQVVAGISELQGYLESAKSFEARLSSVNYEELKKKLSAVDARIEDLRKRQSGLEERVRALYLRLVELSGQVSGIKAKVGFIDERLKEAERLEKELVEKRSRMERLARLRDKLKSVENVVEHIEDRIISEIASDFRKVYLKYASLLLRDQPISTNVTDKFGVVVKLAVGSRHHEIGSLSGGQSIAISLAYRLALNTVIRAYSPSLRGCTLILDEPTTGFSRELVLRLREVLRTLREAGSGQIIVVTHDETLMEVGDCKIRLELDTVNHETKVHYEECVVGDTDFESYKQFVESLLQEKLKAPKQSIVG